MLFFCLFIIKKDNSVEKGLHENYFLMLQRLQPHSQNNVH